MSTEQVNIRQSGQTPRYPHVHVYLVKYTCSLVYDYIDNSAVSCAWKKKNVCPFDKLMNKREISESFVEA